MAKQNNLKRTEQSRLDKRAMLAQWRASRVKDLTLPSGLDLKVRDVSMTDLMLSGRLPDSMLDFAQDASAQGAKDIDLKAMVKNGHDFQLLIDEVVMLCVVEPPIAKQPDDEHLGIDELNGDDKMFIFNWVNREVEQLRPFREGEAQPPAAV
ncbi:MAG: hypothetical protein EHM40_11570 [Chloroflexi bacterium]|nr:MAG: hypothetical protein EHM40_11570 [Chloroflexota bacterium]